MLKLLSSAAALLAFAMASPAWAANAILITHAKALAGNVAPGDTAGYPVTISRPGSYELGSGLYPTAGAAIVITGRNVALDLGGYEIHGGGVANNGIYGSGEGVTIRNGAITGFKFQGIHITVDHVVIESVRTFSNGGDGIRCKNQCIIRNVNSHSNGGNSISSGGHVLIVENIVSENNAAGISISGGTVLNNNIMGNSGYGIESSSTAGFGNNTLAFNNESQVQVNGLSALQPNVCVPACP